MNMSLLSTRRTLYRMCWGRRIAKSYKSPYRSVDVGNLHDEMLCFIACAFLMTDFIPPPSFSGDLLSAYYTQTPSLKIN